MSVLWGWVALRLFDAYDTWLTLLRKLHLPAYAMESRTWYWLLGETGYWIYRHERRMKREEEEGANR